jgi:hypothetical protein
MDARTLKACREARKAHPHYNTKTILGVARSELAIKDQQRTLWEGDKIPSTEYTLRITIEQDAHADSPWETMSVYCTPEYTSLPERYSEKEVLDRDGRKAWLYDTRAAIEQALKEWAPKHVGLLTRKERAELIRRVTPSVHAEREHFGRWLRGLWTYVVVTVSAIDAGGKEIASECLGGVEEEYAHYAILDYGMVDAVVTQAKEAQLGIHAVD